MWVDQIATKMHPTGCCEPLDFSVEDLTSPFRMSMSVLLCFGLCIFRAIAYKLCDMAIANTFHLPKR